MKSILDIVQGIHNLQKVPATMKYIQYDERISPDTKTAKGVVLHKVALFTQGYEKEVKKAQDFEYSPNVLIMSQDQFNNILKPLFDNIGHLNRQVRELQEMVEFKEGK